MIEPIMFVGIGVFVAGLLVIGVIPLVHARAVRLTMRRLEALTPLSMAEIQADKDQLRAEFAMSTRRLEMSVEQMKAKTTNQLAEIGKKSEAIGRLKLELGEKTAALFALEAKEKQLTDDLQGVRAELDGEDRRAGGGANARSRRRRRSSPRSAPTSTKARVTADSQRVELVALARADRGSCKGQIESYEQEAKELRERLANKTTEVEMLSQQLAEERGKAEQLGTRVGELDRQIIVQTTESEVLEPPRPGADRPARRAGTFPGGSRVRLRPAAQRGDDRAEDRSRGSRRTRRCGEPPPLRHRGRSGRRRRWWRISSGNRRRSAPSCSARSRR